MPCSAIVLLLLLFFSIVRASLMFLILFVCVYVCEYKYKSGGKCSHIHIHILQLESVKNIVRQTNRQRGRDQE